MSLSLSQSSSLPEVLAAFLFFLGSSRSPRNSSPTGVADSEAEIGLSVKVAGSSSLLRHDNYFH